MPVKRRRVAAHAAASSKRSAPATAAATTATAAASHTSASTTSIAHAAAGSSLGLGRPKRLYDALSVVLTELPYDVLALITAYDKECVVVFVCADGTFTVWSVDGQHSVTQPLFDPSQTVDVM